MYDHLSIAKGEEDTDGPRTVVRIREHHLHAHAANNNLVLKKLEFFVTKEESIDCTGQIDKK